MINCVYYALSLYNAHNRFSLEVTPGLGKLCESSAVPSEAARNLS